LRYWRIWAKVAAVRMKKPTFTLFSPETDTEYWIFIDAPKAPGPWPAVAFMDGDDMFAAAVAAYHTLPAGIVPPLLLVGVGYGGSFGRPENKRGRDYTPVNHSYEPDSGGANAFLRFLSATLWPELEKRYAIDPARRGIAGHSLGALFALHSLFQPEPFFTHFLASAPSTWWADGAILRHAADFRARHAVLPGRLFLSVGEKDSNSTLADFALLETQLAAKPFEQLEIISRRFPKKTHFNVLSVAFQTGLQELFGSQ